MNTTRLILIFASIAFLQACRPKAKEKTEPAPEIEAMADLSYQKQEVTYSNASYSNKNYTISANSMASSSSVVNNHPPYYKQSGDKKRIIKDGYISIKADAINASKKSIDALLKKYDAYYETENLQNNNQSISYDLRIRVPANNFEKLISGIGNSEDEVTGKNINARDVTEEYVDTETRLATKRSFLQRYITLLAKASSVKDILEIEENIRVLQEEIESKEGQLNYLNDQISFSTLSINLYTEKEFKPHSKDSFFARIAKSFGSGWTSIVNFMLWMMSIWPLIFSVFIVIFVIRRINRKRRNG